MNGKTYPLWAEGQVPGALGNEDADVPTVTVYSPQVGRNNGAAIVICPGGGYQGLAGHEGLPVAEWLNANGATGVVLKYRLGPRYHHPTMWNDVGRAIRFTRSQAKEWAIDPQRVGVLGFSAGGHLASTISTHFSPGDPNAADPVEQFSSRPDAAVLIYPVITLEGEFAHAGSRKNLLGDDPDPELVKNLSNHTHVTRETPPTFLVHSVDDGPVPVENSLMYASALSAAKVPFGMQIFEHGGHGYGMAKNDPVLNAWTTQCAAWLRHRGFFGPAAALLAALLLLTAPTLAQEATLAMGKWHSLFDGKTLNGWERKAVHGGNGGLWEVQQGNIVGNQEPDHKGGLLGTRSLFTDAEVELEFKADEPVDTGLFLRTTRTGDAYQITIDVRGDGTIGSIYVPSAGFVARDDTWRTKYKPGEWNKLKARIVGNPARVQVWLNDKPTVDFTDSKTRLAEPGYIGLQVHGGPSAWGNDCRIRYRKVRIKPLKGEA
ncbi:MAG: hypothetical protein OHK0029_21100 [Armatimonadaceae bacterium]